jgi:ferredoxin-NADP reductase
MADAPGVRVVDRTGPGGAPWQLARVVAIHPETERATSFRLQLSDPFVHVPGQHVVLRLTAPDGYTAQRSYSIASAPDPGGVVELTVERLPDGEVSGFLHDVVEVGDELEVRGPIGGWFVWRGDRPALLVGGGSGVVPFMSMLRHARALGREDLLRLVVSVRRFEDLLYADEIRGPRTTVVTTRAPLDGSARPPHRIDADDLMPVVAEVPADAPVYVCGSNRFADAVTDLLIDGGLAPERIRVERFGEAT